MIRIERVQMGPQPGAGGLNGDLPDRQTVAANLGRSAAAEVKVHGRVDPTAAKRWRRAPSAQKRLVDVVVQDLDEPGDILAAQRARQGFGNSVADRIRMPEPLRSTTSTVWSGCASGERRTGHIATDRSLDRPLPGPGRKEVIQRAEAQSDVPAG